MIELTQQAGGADEHQRRRGDQALAAYRTGLAALRRRSRGTARTSTALTLATRPLDQKRLENIATAASDVDRAATTWFVMRLLKLLGIDSAGQRNIPPLRH